MKWFNGNTALTLPGGLLALCLWSLPPVSLAAATCNSNIRPTTPTTDFTLDEVNGTATHAQTGLTWMRCSLGQTWASATRTCTGTPQTYPWGEALRAAQGYAFVGHNDWRVPNVKELETIIEERCYNPSINETVFPGTYYGGGYWSSSTSAVRTDGAWFVNFDVGYVEASVKAVNGHHVRLARGGQSFGDFTGEANSPTLAISKTGTGTGVVTSTPSGIDCGAVCSVAFPVGTVVTPTATADTGSTFAGWNPASCSTPFKITADTACTATFNLAAPNTYALTVSKAGTGSGTVTGTGIDCGSDCTESYTSGTSVTLIATATIGSTFAGWNPASCGNPFNIASNTTCTATFDSEPLAGQVIRQYLGSSPDNIIVAGVAGHLVEVLDFGGLDTYTLLPTLAGPVRITDNQAGIINLPAGLTISAAQFISTGVRFTINGHDVTLLGKPDLFTFVFAGSLTDPQAGVRRTLAETAALFGVQVPVAGQPPTVALITGTIQPDGTLDVNN